MTTAMPWADLRAGTVAVYGAPPRELVGVPPGADQLSPLVPGSHAIEDIGDATLSGMVIAAPPGTLERRYVLAQAMRALAPGAPLVALAPKDKGGARLRAEIEGFGATAEGESRRHHRIVLTRRPDAPEGVAAAIAAGAARYDADLGMWTQPGVFSWDRIDAGSALLARHLPPLEGRGADLGCGTGYLARVALAASAGIAELRLVDLDRRAVDCARRNVADARARFDWADVRALAFADAGIDFVLMNPPFHDGGAEDRALGLAFLRRAAEHLSRGGKCLMVANRHLPYEAELRQRFGSVRLLAQEGGYKVCEATR